MKYSILGFNQEKIVAYDKDGLRCDLTDLLLLNYIVYAQANPKMKHIMDENDNPCVWLYHEHILNELPILNISEGTLKNRLTKLRKMGLIASKTVANENSQGSRTYYRITSLLYDMLFETTSLKNDVLEESRHSKMTSDTLTNSNTKVNTKTNSKELVENFEFGKQKPKKESLYTRCLAMIDDFLADNLHKDTLKPLLVQYLNLRLEMRDKPIYANQWKGLLNKLQKVFVANPSNDMEDIIRQSIERGYASFFPVKSYSYASTSKPWEDDVRTSKYSDAELRELEEIDADRRARGLRTKF